MRIYLILIFLNLNFFAKAQNSERKVSAALKIGPIFTHFISSFYPGIRDERYNEWNIELSIEETKKGLGFITRYIAAPGFIPNPFYIRSPSIDRSTLKKGDLVFRKQEFERFSFLLSKRLFLLNSKHRIDIGSGIQFREGNLGYFDHVFGGFELHLTYEPLDKYGFLSRIGYSYLINKHFSVSANVEYSRFRKKPANFSDVNILAGVRF